MVKVNNYDVSLRKEGEVAIHTTRQQLEATNGNVYLTILELRNLLKLAEAKPSSNGGDYADDWFCQHCKALTSHDIYTVARKRKCNRCNTETPA